MPLPPATPRSQPLRLLVHRPQPSGRVLLEVLDPPAALRALGAGVELVAVIEPAIEDYAPLLVRLPLPDPARAP